HVFTRIPFKMIMQDRIGNGVGRLELHGRVRNCNVAVAFYADFAANLKRNRHYFIVLWTHPVSPFIKTLYCLRHEMRIRKEKECRDVSLESVTTDSAVPGEA